MERFLLWSNDINYIYALHYLISMAGVRDGCTISYSARSEWLHGRLSSSFIGGHSKTSLTRSLTALDGYQDVSSSTVLMFSIDETWSGMVLTMEGFRFWQKKLATNLTQLSVLL